jgi:MYXO-CTERM domain-containing protein
VTRSICLLLGLLAAAAPLFAAEPEILRADFRGKPIDEKLFQKFGVKDQIRIEPEGLRITLPGGGGQAADTGIQTRFRIVGDFDITASFELLSAEIPLRARGVGVTLHARLGDPAETSPFMGRFNRQDGSWYTCDRGAFDENRQRHIEERQFPSEATAGRLRLMRRGSVVTYAVADGGSDDFRRLWDWEVGTADIKVLRLQAENQKSDAPLDVRFLDLEIRSGQSFAKDGTPLVSEGGSKGGLVAIEILTLAVLVILLALWRRRRRRDRGAAAAQNPSSVQAEVRS